MYSTINKTRGRFAVSVAIALVGAIAPAGAFAVSPTPTPPAIHQILQASQAHPVLAIPGDPVDVTLKTGKTRVLLVGPKTPPVIANALPSTFIFSFQQESGKTLIDIHDFGILDGDATLIRPIHFDDGSISFYLNKGQKRTVKITTFMASGTGTLRWAPLNHYVTDWQFVEETD